MKYFVILIVSKTNISSFGSGQFQEIPVQEGISVQSYVIEWSHRL
jgi:hypothetical protein